MPRETSALSPDLVYPRKHLNGSDWKRLSLQYRKAYAAINNALAALSAVDFHLRDYYVISNDAYYQALSFRERQFDDLTRIRAELYAHLENATEQDPKALD
jgi:outer membrane lipopolysaccharide assembly protein LptE/RlpB